MLSAKPVRAARNQQEEPTVINQKTTIKVPPFHIRIPGFRLFCCLNCYLILEAISKIYKKAAFIDFPPDLFYTD